MNVLISGSMEFSIAGHPDDFFPVNVSFVSKKTYCALEVRWVDFLTGNLFAQQALVRKGH